jgi:hypothetical protein
VREPLASCVPNEDRPGPFLLLLPKWANAAKPRGVGRARLNRRSSRGGRSLTCSARVPTPGASSDARPHHHGVPPFPVVQAPAWRFVFTRIGFSFR